MKTIDLCKISIFTVFLIVCSQISIPMVVPFTLQTLAIYLLLSYFNDVRALYSIFLYLLLGLLGFPVFANLSGGINVLFGATGGFLFGFITLGIVYLILVKFKVTKYIASIIALFVLYVVGTVWFSVMYLNELTLNSIQIALGFTVYPFIVFDIIKMYLGIFIGESSKKYTRNKK